MRHHEESRREKKTEEWPKKAIDQGDIRCPKFLNPPIAGRPENELNERTQEKDVKKLQAKEGR